MGNASSSIPVVSVVIPVHNYARYVPEAIASVQAQTLQAWECVVVDDGSTDDTPEVLARLSALDDRITVVRQAQRGLSAARNHGLQASRGRYVQFLDADDLLHEGKLEVHVKALEARPDVDIVFGPTSYFDDGEPAVLRSALRKFLPQCPAPVRRCCLACWQETR
jgi:glycosyltransferase involved in cell wall biosynthesis